MFQFSWMPRLWRMRPAARGRSRSAWRVGMPKLARFFCGLCVRWLVLRRSFGLNLKRADSPIVSSSHLLTERDFQFGDGGLELFIVLSDQQASANLADMLMCRQGNPYPKALDDRELDRVVR